MKKELVKIPKAAEITGISETTLKNACKDGRLAYARDGDDFMVRVDRIHEAVAEGRIKAKGNGNYR